MYKKIIISDKNAKKIKFTKEVLKTAFLVTPRTVIENINKKSKKFNYGEKSKEEYESAIFKNLENEIRNGELSDTFAYSRCSHTGEVVEQRRVQTENNNVFLVQYLYHKNNVTVLAYFDEYNFKQ
ncbi:MAG: hypothetical protein GY870_05390 [archaeon]|nr:hypothetical protein [archaeon]